MSAAVRAASAKITAVADWLDTCAEADERRAQTEKHRLPSFADACAHDARERRRAAKNLRSALATLTEAAATRDAGVSAEPPTGGS